MGKKQTVQNIHYKTMSGYFIRGVLFISAICLLNTLFFAIIQTSQIHQLNPHTSSLSYNNGFTIKTVDVKVSKSLLRFFVEKFLIDSHSPSDAKDKVHEELHKVEYIYQKYIWQFNVSYAGKIASISCNHSSLINPFLETLTPPPKMAA